MYFKVCSWSLVLLCCTAGLQPVGQNDLWSQTTSEWASNLLCLQKSPHSACVQLCCLYRLAGPVSAYSPRRPGSVPRNPCHPLVVCSKRGWSVSPASRSSGGSLLRCPPLLPVLLPLHRDSDENGLLHLIHTRSPSRAAPPRSPHNLGWCKVM